MDEAGDTAVELALLPRAVDDALWHAADVLAPARKKAGTAKEVSALVKDTHNAIATARRVAASHAAMLAACEVPEQLPTRSLMADVTEELQRAEAAYTAGAQSAAAAA